MRSRILIGVTIGGGIFLVPNMVAQNLTSQPAILGIWAFAGLISFFGALACAELGTALPAAGGQYVFLREAYGPLAGFLCGWSSFAVARTAQVSWLASRWWPPAPRTLSGMSSGWRERGCAANLRKGPEPRQHPSPSVRRENPRRKFQRRNNPSTRSSLLTVNGLAISLRER
jgi:hypothetical protein